MGMKDVQDLRNYDLYSLLHHKENDEQKSQSWETCSGLYNASRTCSKVKPIELLFRREQE